MPLSPPLVPVLRLHKCKAWWFGYGTCWLLEWPIWKFEQQGVSLRSYLCLLSLLKLVPPLTKCLLTSSLSDLPREHPVVLCTGDPRDRSFSPTWIQVTESPVSFSNTAERPVSSLQAPPNQSNALVSFFFFYCWLLFSRELIPLHHMARGIPRAENQKVEAVGVSYESRLANVLLGNLNSSLDCHS